MGFKFRKRIKILPGVKLNVTSKGISSVSIGGKGATINAGEKGTKATVGIPGSGLSYSTKLNNKKSKNDNQNELATANIEVPDTPKRKVSFLLAIGIFFMPYIFSWFLFRSGHSYISRLISFLWLVLFLIAVSKSKG